MSAVEAGSRRCHCGRQPCPTRLGAGYDAVQSRSPRHLHALPQAHDVAPDRRCYRNFQSTSGSPSHVIEAGDGHAKQNGADGAENGDLEYRDAIADDRDAGVVDDPVVLRVHYSCGGDLAARVSAAGYGPISCHSRTWGPVVACDVDDRRVKRCLRR